jgi:hypothetical protein
VVVWLWDLGCGGGGGDDQWLLVAIRDCGGDGLGLGDGFGCVCCFGEEREVTAALLELEGSCSQG